MAPFQTLVLALLIEIVIGLALALGKFPTQLARAEMSHPVPIIIAGSKGTGCPAGYTCAAVFGSGLSTKPSR